MSTPPAPEIIQHPAYRPIVVSNCYPGSDVTRGGVTLVFSSTAVDPESMVPGQRPRMRQILETELVLGPEEMKGIAGMLGRMVQAYEDSFGALPERAKAPEPEEPKE